MDKVELHHVKMYEPAEFGYLVTVFVEAKFHNCNLLKVMSKGTDDADKINIVVDWLVNNYPDEFQLPKNVYGEATFK